MTPDELKNRTKAFAINSIKLIRNLKNNQENWVIGKQLLRSATSVAANYRAACRSRSDQEFAAKIGLVVEEADESALWLEIIIETEMSNEMSVKELEKEAKEITAIMTASRQSILKRLGRK